MRRISELVLIDKHAELREAIAAVVGHDRFVFMVLAEQEDGTVVRMSNSDDVEAVLTHLSHT